VYEVTPVLAILDTDLVARNLLESNFSTPITNFKLSTLLSELKCPYESSDLHNSGNDATFTLHAMLLLVITSSECKETGSIQRENLERLQVVAQMELYECQRWKLTRRPLGFYAPGSPDERDSNTQSNQSNR
jgi:hypothetical protein